ncbi:MAG TPA: tripartite tricarboxylate transporter TctB family protein [Crenalkalicoccus sp.]|nr:tripartite tricarboxylate transporter TctB family protein [Crenalkalicoccus sp.]
MLLILIAAAGLWLNQDHALGSARRMGPGYMPMLVFVVQVALGAAVLLGALFNGPDPLRRWTGLETGSLVLAVLVGTVVSYAATAVSPYFSQTYNGIGLGLLAGFFVLCLAAGWQLIALILAAMCVFGLLLEQGGLMLAIIGTVVVSALADPDHRRRPLGVAGLTVFLLALCWWIFIKQLDIRVPVWPQL